METLTGRGRLADRGRRLLAGASPKGHMDGNAGVAAGAPGRGVATNPADRMPLGKREGAGWRNPKVVRLEERRTQKGKATFFRSMSGRGLTDPRTSPCRLWGCPKKASGEFSKTSQKTKHHVLPSAANVAILNARRAASATNTHRPVGQSPGDFSSSPSFKPV